jgi:hypothetical protein
VRAATSARHDVGARHRALQAELEAQARIETSDLTRREIIRRMASSPAQLYRLLDQTNYRKRIDQMVKLLNILDCEVGFVVREKKRKSA